MEERIPHDNFRVNAEKSTAEKINHIGNINIATLTDSEFMV